MGWLLSSKRCRIAKHANKSFRTDAATFTLAVVRILCVGTRGKDSERSYLSSTGKWKRSKKCSWRNAGKCYLRCRAVLLSCLPPFDKRSFFGSRKNKKGILSLSCGVTFCNDMMPRNGCQCSCSRQKISLFTPVSSYILRFERFIR